MGDWKSLVEEVQKKTSLPLPPNKFLLPDIVLREYQKIGAFLLHLCKNFLLADDCGLGKTLQTMMGFALRKQADEKAGVEHPRLLVVTERSAVLQWVEEVGKFFTGITAIPIPAGYKDPGFPSPSSYRRYLYQTSTEDIFVVGHRTFTLDWRKGEIRDLVKRSILVLDEANYIRGETSKAFYSFSESVPTSLGFKALTATPIVKGLEDYFQIMRLISPGLFGTRKVFLQEFCKLRKLRIPQGGTKEIIKGYKAVPKFQERMKGYFLMRTYDQVGHELPETLEKPILLDMEADQRRVYEEADSMALNLLSETLKYRPGEDEPTYLERIKQTKESKLVRQIRMVQATDHPELVERKSSSVKTERLIELLGSDLHHDQVVVYTKFKSCVDILQRDLDQAGIETCRITGDESMQERNDARKALERPGPPYVMLVTDTARRALNLQCAGTMVFYDLPWTWGDFHQIVGRIKRMGSKRSTILVAMLIIRDTIDEIVYRVLRTRASLVQEATGRRGLMEVTPALLEEILTRMKAGKKIEEAVAC